jgi:hypothetical protein
VWWLPGLVLQTTALMMSVAWGLLTYGASAAWWGGGRAAVASGALVGVLSGVFALIVLAFINSGGLGGWLGAGVAGAVWWAGGRGLLRTPRRSGRPRHLGTPRRAPTPPISLLIRAPAPPPPPPPPPS